MQDKRFTLRNGVEIPVIGFGTGVVRRFIRKPSVFVRARIRPVLSGVRHLDFAGLHKMWLQDFGMGKVIDEAISQGYTLLDTGRGYGHSELEIGKAVASSSLKRSDFFINTKVSDMDLFREYSPDDVEGNFRLSLKYLQTDYVDGYLLHWPHGNWLDIYRQMEDIYEAGLARSIGVCNFHLEHFMRLEQSCRVMPMLHQTELHPLNSKKEIRQYCKKNGILIMAHTPTGRMCNMIRQNEILKKLAEKHNKTIAQIIVRWHYQNGVVPIIATQSTVHMDENMDIFDFELSESDMDMIESIDQGEVLLPGNGVDDTRYIWNL